MRAQHSRSGTGIFHRENSTGSSINSPFSLNTLYFIKRPKIHKDHACTGREKAKCVKLHMCTSKCQRVWERRKKTQGQKTGWTLPKQNGQIAGGAPCSQCHCSVFLPLPSPDRSENKKVFCSVCCGFASMQHMADYRALLFVLAVFPLSFPSRDSVAPSLPDTSLSTQTTPLQGPHWTVCWQNWRSLHQRSPACCTITVEDPPNQNEGKASGTATITSFKTVHREKLWTLADLSIWIIAMVFL